MDDRKILEHFPLPIARGWRRFLNAAEVRERHDAAYYLYEVYLKLVAATAIGHYIARDAREHRLNTTLKGLVRPSTGEWLRFLRECLRYLAVEKPEPAIEAMGELWRRKEAGWTAAVALSNSLETFLTGAVAARTRINLEELLDQVVAYRNRVLGHGAPLTGDHYRCFADLLADSFRNVLERSPFLSARLLVSITSVEVKESSRLDCTVVEFMGDHPLRRQTPLSLPYGSAPPRAGALHLLDADQRLLCLDPLLVAREDDVYFLNEAHGLPEYLSYSTGERYRPSGMGRDAEALFERILGYSVDESRMGVIEDDLDASVAAESETNAAETEHRRLGDYRILREVGRGAMGVVFEAVQESLGRRVALKVLPGSFALDRRRVERFHREARATARIHHPHIVPVYEVGEATGTHYYAMEFVEGVPLDERIATIRGVGKMQGSRWKRGSSSSDAAYITSVVEQFAGLAEGLIEAHRLGLVHRDLKPSNVLVEASGRYVLVDFGLVQEAQAEALTRSGELVGTVGYMSPEQVARNPVDARADVYSLATTLYEALTLLPPFVGSSDHDTQRAILFEEPPSPRRLNPRISVDLQVVLLHALEKNPARRYPSMVEFASDLRRVLRNEPIHARPAGALTRIARRAWRRRGTLAIGLLTVLLVGAAVLILHITPGTRFVLTRLEPLTSDAGLTTDPSLSGDAKLLVYASDRGRTGNLDIWLERPRGKAARRLTSHEGDDHEPDLSPDGRRVAFRSERESGGIYLVGTNGEGERLLATRGRRPRFSPDGTLIAYWAGSVGGAHQDAMVFVVPSSGGEPLNASRGLSGARYPIWCHGGRDLLMYGAWEASEIADWWLVPLGGGAPIQTGVYRLLEQNQVPRSDIGHNHVRPEAWVEADGLVLFSAPFGNSENLWACPLAASGKANHRLWRLTSGTARELKPSIATGGSAVFASIISNVDIWSVRLDPQGDPTQGELERWTESQGLDAGVSTSTEGTKVVFASTRGGNSDIFLLDLERGGEAVALASGPENQYRPLISREGSRVVYEQGRPWGLYVVDLSADGLRPRRIAIERGYHPRAWLLGSHALVYNQELQEPVRSALFVLDVESGKADLFAEDPGLNLWEGSFSSDDRWFVCNGTGVTNPQARLFALPYEPGRATPRSRWIELTGGDPPCENPRWALEGDLVYFTSEEDGFRCLWGLRLDQETKRPAGARFPVRHLHETQLSMLGVSLNALEVSVSRDRIFFSLEARSGNLWGAQLAEDR